MNIQSETRDYANRLSWYIDSKKVPKLWFASPDHVNVAADDIADFERLVKEPKKERAIVLDPQNDERFLIAAKFSAALSVGRLGFVEWAEITEPTSSEQALGLTGVQTMHFYYPKFEEVRRILGYRGIPYNILDEVDHAKINVVIDPEGNNFRLTNKPLEAVALEMVDRGEAQDLIPQITPN